jgi:CheY-like chemotaxis protein
VLIVDDSATLRRAFRELFENSGWSVLEAENGREAVEIVERNSPAVIILDIEMPVMNGVHAAELLKAKAPHAKIIMCSLYATDEAINREMYRSGIRNVLMKSDAYLSLVPTAERLVAQERGFE